MPCSPIPRVGVFRAGRECANDIRSAAGEPVRICQNDHRLRVVRTLGYDPLVGWDDDLGHVAIWLRRTRQLLRARLRRKRSHTIDQCTDVPSESILFDDLSQAGLRGGWTRFHAPILFDRSFRISHASRRARGVTLPTRPKPSTIAVLMLAEDADRTSVLRAQLAMVLPQATVTTSDSSSLTEGAMPEADVAVVAIGSVTQQAPADALRLLRARGFGGPIVIVSASPDESGLHVLMHSLGAVGVSRAVVDGAPTELGAAVIGALGTRSSAASAQLTHARRVFAAGQVALSLQHGINNPLAALLAEAQLLQLEELTSEQRASVDRMVELCRRVVALVRRLDALAEGT